MCTTVVLSIRVNLIFKIFIWTRYFSSVNEYLYRYIQGSVVLWAWFGGTRFGQRERERAYEDCPENGQLKIILQPNCQTLKQVGHWAAPLITCPAGLQGSSIYGPGVVLDRDGFASSVPIWELPEMGILDLQFTSLSIYISTVKNSQTQNIFWTFCNLDHPQ